MVTAVPIKTIDFWSPSGRFLVGYGRTSFSTGTDSPVSAASSTRG
jgi:hypothetical protein